jgi:hypothetical protein
MYKGGEPILYQAILWRGGQYAGDELPGGG